MAPKRRVPKIPSPSSTSSSDGEQKEEEEVEVKVVSPSPKKKKKKKPNNLASSVPIPKPKPSQPSSESSQEEDEDEEDDDDDSASDSENKKQPQPQPPPKVNPVDSDSSSSDEESDNPTRGADPSIKPISSKPMDEAPAPKPQKLPAAPTPTQQNPDSRKLLKRNKPPPDDGRTAGGNKRRRRQQPFQSIWSEDDVVAVLRGLIEYHSNKGSDPSSSLLDRDAFHNFIRPSLQTEHSKSQIADKISRLKKKYFTNAARREDGTEPSFSTPHDQTVHDLSKKIWGPKGSTSEDVDASGDINGVGHSKRKPKGQTSMPTEEADGDEEVEVSFPLLREAISQMTNWGMISLAPSMKVLEMIDSPKVKMIEEKLLKLKLTEMKLDSRQMDLMKEAIKLLADALAKSLSGSG